jgi:soluble lytic murein transglycosylase-like protein
MSLSTIDAIQYRPRKPGSTTTMAPGASRIVKGSFLRHQTMYGLVRGHAVDMEVAPAFALAVVDVESGFNPDAVSTAGALGLMQLMPSTITTLKVSNPFDPSQNVAAGLSLFKVYSRRYGTVDELLAAYHSGAEHLRRYGVTNSDREYIHRVVEKWHFYEHVLNDALVQEDPLGDALTLTSPLKM